MLTVQLNKKSVLVPNRWADFEPGDPRFVALAGELGLFETGQSDFPRLRIGIAVALLGLRMDRLEYEGSSSVLFENIYRVSEMLDFPIGVVEREDRSLAVSIDVVLDKNLAPKLKSTRGYSFFVHPDGQVDCTLTADTYIDALGLMQAWNDGHQMRSLESLAELLYPGILEMKPESADLFAVYYNFRGILAWLRALPTYALIFRSTANQERAAAANPVGLSSSIFSLAKAGYGDIDTIRNLPLLSYLSLLVQQTVDSIKALESVKLKPTEIADRLHLPVELILPITAEQ